MGHFNLPLVPSILLSLQLGDCVAVHCFFFFNLLQLLAGQKKSSPFWTFEYYQTFFDVDTYQVCRVAEPWPFWVAELFPQCSDAVSGFVYRKWSDRRDGLHVEFGSG